MNTFAERLKYAMEQADLKQSALSEQAGISKAAISQYLSGKNTPNQERIKALADVTGVTFDFLMGYGAAPVTDAPPPVKKISVKEAARCMGKSDQFVRKMCIRDRKNTIGFDKIQGLTELVQRCFSVHPKSCDYRPGFLCPWTHGP